MHDGTFFFFVFFLSLSFLGCINDNMKVLNLVEWKMWIYVQSLICSGAKNGSLKPRAQNSAIFIRAALNNIWRNVYNLFLNCNLFIVEVDRVVYFIIYFSLDEKMRPFFRHFFLQSSSFLNETRLDNNKFGIKFTRRVNRVWQYHIMM